jgi:hypothetical protein
MDLSPLTVSGGPPAANTTTARRFSPAATSAAVAIPDAIYRWQEERHKPSRRVDDQAEPSQVRQADPKAGRTVGHGVGG